jgi:hypothetical protein
MVFYFDFIQIQCISLTFTFAFGPFKSWLQNFSLVQTDSKFQNFGLCDEKSWKSQYHSYLHCNPYSQPFSFRAPYA